MSKTKRERKYLFWIFKILSVLVSCAFPIYAILEKFPVWVKASGISRSAMVGIILIIIVMLIIFRKAVFDFIKEKIDLKHAPPITVWITCLIVSYILVYIGNFMADLAVVFWMGLIGCLIGNVLTFFANRFAKEEVTEKAEEKTDE